MKSVSYFTLLILFIMSLPGQFVLGDVLHFTLDSFLERAVTKDLRVGQSVFGKDAAEARKTIALAAPDPEASLSYGTDALGNDQGERAVGFSLSQTIRLPGQKRALREIANTETTMANASLREATRQATFRAKGLFLQVLAARERVSFAREASELASELATFVASAEGRGEASGIDVGQTKLKSLSAKEKLAANEQELNELLAQAGIILRTKPDDELVLEGTLTFPEERPAVPNDVSNWRTQRPDLALLAGEQQRASARLHKKKADRWGRWRLEGFVEHAREIDSPGGLEREKFHGIGIAIELPWWGRRQGEEREAKARLGAASLRRDILAESIAIEVRTAAQRERILFQRLSNFREILSPLAEVNGKDALKAFSQGQISLQQALQVREETLGLKGEYLNLLLEYHLAAMRLRMALGG